ncbi:RNA polymerase sigma factor [Sphingobacterium luzhongxinii]|uniref:RNA polymerase sigma factor n=1 Tax=Sphingobacterium luzhongxinii TaxID=2654181 RepID=UPI0013DD54D3|nr:sigma-70 family RNA polymerase sigma factor [Sphingobacterium sp. xlx-73]
MTAEITELLFKQYYARLCVYATALLGDPHAAEDVVAAVFLNMVANATSEVQRIGLPYLYRAVKNGCLKNIRKENTHTKYLASGMIEISEEGYDQRIIQAELTVALSALLEELPEGCSRILKMSYVEGLKNAEIAEKLCISIHTVKSQKNRGLMLLRERVSLHYLLTILLFLKNF